MAPKNQKTFLILFIIFIICWGIISIDKTALAAPDPPQNQEEQTTPQENFTPEIEYPTPFGQEPTKSLPDYVSYIYKFAIWSSGFLAMLMLVVGGIRLIGAGGNPQNLLKAREQILNSIIGLGIVLLSASILNLLNPELLVLKNLSVKEYTPQKSLDELIKEYKNRQGGGSYNLYVGAVYDAGKNVSCYIAPEEEESAETEKRLITGENTQDCKGISGDPKDIYCLTSNFGNEDEAPENVEDVNSCEKICTINSSCTKVEGYIDNCEYPASCAQVKALGIKSDCNENYIYCLTSRGGGGVGGGGPGPIAGSLNTPYICQHDLNNNGIPDWEEQGGNAEFRLGCSFVATTIFINYYYDPDLSPKEVKNVMGSAGPQQSINAIRHYLPNKNPQIVEGSNEEKLKKAEEEIKEGDVVLISTNRPYAATDAGHVMVIVGFTSEGNVIIHDPNGADLGGSRPFLNKEGRNWNNGAYLIAPRDELIKAIRYIIIVE